MLKERMDDYEKLIIEKELKENGYVIAKTARKLDIKRTTLVMKIQKHCISFPQKLSTHRGFQLSKQNLEKRKLIARTLRMCGGHVPTAARILGRSQTSIRYWKHHIAGET